MAFVWNTNNTNKALKIVVKMIFIEVIMVQVLWFTFNLNILYSLYDGII